MVEQIYSITARKISQNKRHIEQSLNVRLDVRGNIIFFSGKAEDELVCREVIEAINLGFSVSQALDLKHEDSAFEKILIKSLSKRKDLSQVRARIIGSGRKVLRTIESLTGAEIVVHENIVGIIGPVECVKKASFAVKKIIMGSKHTNVYAWLEQQVAIEREKFI